MVILVILAGRPDDNVACGANTFDAPDTERPPPTMGYLRDTRRSCLTMSVRALVAWAFPGARADTRGISDLKGARCQLLTLPRSWLSLVKRQR